MSAPSPFVRALTAQGQQAAPAPARHLAAHSFRFDTAAPPAARALPASGMDWTLAQTLAELRRRGTAVDVGSGGLRVRHAHRVPQLAVAVGRHPRAVAAWLALGPAPAPALGWDDEADLLARWFDAQPEPAGPVALRAGVSVTDWSRFRASVFGRYAQGPDAACADGLQRDLRDLFERSEPARVLPIRPAARARAA